MAGVLLSIDPNNATAIKMLLDRADGQFGSGFAVETLANAGTNAAAAIPGLKRLLRKTQGGLFERMVSKDRGKERAEAIQEALDKIQPESASKVRPR